MTGLAILTIVMVALMGFVAGWIVRDRKEPTTLEEQRRISAQKWEQERTELENNHAWEIRRLTARAEDAEHTSERYQSSYKAALAKLKRYRKSLGQAKRQLLAAGLAQDADPNEDGTPKLESSQAVFDRALAEIPMMDDMSQGVVRSYIERQFRARGPKAGEDILAEVLAGDIEE